MNETLYDKYLLPTATGAFYTVLSNKAEPSRQFLRQLMSDDECHAIDSESLNRSFNHIGHQIEVLYQIQKNGWLQGFSEQKKIGGGTIEDELPLFLEKLSSEKKALLADDQGFCIVSTGFSENDAELLAALSADLSVVSSLHKNDILDKLNIKSGALALIDASGHSKIGFWPIYVGDFVFHLVVSGFPDFEQDIFVDFIWSLHQRFCSY